MLVSDNEQSYNQKIEEWNIIYDILIDEEQYDEIKIPFEFNYDSEVPEGKKEIKDIINILTCETICKEKETRDNKPEDGESKQVFRLTEKLEFDRVFGTMKNVNPEQIFRALIKLDESTEKNKTPLRLNDVEFKSSLITLWRPLFIAKKARAALKFTGSSKALKAVDGVAEYLLSKLPDLFKHFSEIREQNANKCPYHKKFGQEKFLVLYYNEISQCYQGYLSVGFADKALQLYHKGKCAYELLGLYNKAIGLAHHEDRMSREKALKYFDEVIDTFQNPEKSKEYGEDFENNKILWEIYIYFPALIQKADVLIKLQRGKESIDVLKRLLGSIKKSITNCNKIKLGYEYKKLQAKILKAHAMIEADQDEQEREQLIKELNNLKDLKHKSSDGIIIDRYIYNKHKAFKAKGIIEKVRNKNFEKHNENEGIIVGALQKCYELFCEAKRYKDPTETVLAAFLWLEAFEQYLDNREKIKINDDSEKSEKIFKDLKRITNYIICRLPTEDEKKNLSEKEKRKERLSFVEKWLPKRDEVTKLLSKVLEKFNNSNGEEDIIRKYEIKLCRKLIKANETSNYHKTKYTRRLLLLNDSVSDEDKIFDFPEENKLRIVSDFALNGINRDFYTQRLRLNTEAFDKRLIYSSYWPQYRNCYALTVLRKWQSFTPSLGSYSESSRGGGYFVYKVGNNGQIEEGIVVDPGYDFIENFMECNFSIKDIKAIALTHSHIDHSVDFRGLMTLFHEANKRGARNKKDWKRHKVMIILPPSCFEHFYQVLWDSKEDIKDVLVVDPCDDGQNSSRNYIGDIMEHFVIQAVPACHKEVREDFNCIGLTIKEKRKCGNGRNLIGFTGDTVWTPNLADNIKDFPVVCINMGGLIDVGKNHSFEEIFKKKEKKEDDYKNIKKLIYEQNHLYLPGTIALLEQLRKFKTTKLAVIGEIGQELKSELRKDLFHKLNEFIDNRRGSLCEKPLRVVIEDIGLTVALGFTDPSNCTPYIFCFRCKNRIEPKEIQLRAIDDNRSSEQLHYYCRDCLNIIEAMETGVEKHWQMRYLPPHKP